MIYVTQPSMPPLKEFTKYLEEIWKSRWLTNNGRFHQEFEQALCEYLDVKYISVFSNGTLALITALQTLRITGEVITSPFSFVATTHALHWNGIKPVFVDIEDETFNIDPDKLEAAITPQTTAILPVHVYGTPCDTGKIQKIADNYGLYVIYDACHAFGVKVNGTSVLNFGDLSVLSFHATKVFNTFEGGAIICHDEKTKKRIDFLKNFGFADELTVVAPGINAKMNEVQAAFGLLQLTYVDDYIHKRKVIAQTYREFLQHIEGIRFLDDIPGIYYNYPYFPVLINSKQYGKTRDELYDHLKANGIYSRRYFYPLISDFPTYKGLSSASVGNLPVAQHISKSVLCLPIYPDLPIIEVKNIVNLIKNK
jgi:dTDP-4-amino-4,6-dideoxygalactose transaminase